MHTVGFIRLNNHQQQLKKEKKMMVKNKTNKNYKRSQKGRSMVEMLGVLAIIGVLSVGGISAYGVAMKKHKANELLHQASMLATTISAQVMSNDGKLPETTTSFANSSYGTFDQSVTEALDGKGFAITIENVDSDVCGQLEKMGGGMMRDATCNNTTATLSYYKNLATNDEEGKNSPMGGTADGGEGGGETGTLDPCADVECGEGLSCFRGQCKCPDGLPLCGDQCCSKGTYCTGTHSYSQDHLCLAPNSGCVSNEDCEENQYCRFKGSKCNDLGTGECKDIGTVKTYTLKLPSGDLTLYGGTSANWWSARNWCEANGWRMVTKQDLYIQNSSEPKYTSEFCYFGNHGETIGPCICQNDDVDCTQTKQEVSQIISLAWLGDTRTSGCGGFLLEDEGVLGYYRNEATYISLCIE
jgi:type II secretory pathway pseudopilin PulG